MDEKGIKQWNDGKQVTPEFVVTKRIKSNKNGSTKIIKRKAMTDDGIFIDQELLIPSDVTEIKSGNFTIKILTQDEEKRIAMENVRIRDNWTCQWQNCGKTIRETKLHVNHIFPVSEYPQYELKEDYMICYCLEHHAKWHKARGDKRSALFLESQKIESSESKKYSCPNCGIQLVEDDFPLNEMSEGQKFINMLGFIDKKCLQCGYELDE
ncbi:MAG: hypothetical protein KGI10_08805 [Thaumarchaeota archaeon]|nr:hypothetical protein [Nitrososphaerota archaeon]